MPLKTLSAKFSQKTVEAVKRKCKILRCSQSEYLRWCVTRTNAYVNKSLVYHTSSKKTDELDIKPLEKEIEKKLAEIDTLMGKESLDEG